MYLREFRGTILYFARNANEEERREIETEENGGGGMTSPTETSPRRATFLPCKSGRLENDRTTTVHRQFSRGKSRRFPRQIVSRKLSRRGQGREGNLQIALIDARHARLLLRAANGLGLIKSKSRLVQRCERKVFRRFPMSMAEIVSTATRGRGEV